MIKFFRKIRQKLLSENKFSRYLTYAIGEVFLVVVGILIALSINNWNTERIERKAEQKLLKTLLVDLVSNEEILKTVELEINSQIEQTVKLLALMEDEPNDSSVYKVKGLLFLSSEVADLQINKSGIESLISDNVKLITNDSIKSSILSISRLYEDYKEQENLMKSLKHDRIRPKMQEYISLANIADGSKKFKSDTKGMLSDRTLANYLTDRIWESAEWKEDFITLKKENQRLIGMITKELRTKNK
jgi:hypothetical protein